MYFLSWSTVLEKATETCPISSEERVSIVISKLPSAIDCAVFLSDTKGFINILESINTQIANITKLIKNAPSICLVMLWYACIASSSGIQVNTIKPVSPISVNEP